MGALKRSNVTSITVTYRIACADATTLVYWARIQFGRLTFLVDFKLKKNTSSDDSICYTWNYAADITIPLILNTVSILIKAINTL